MNYVVHVIDTLAEPLGGTAANYVSPPQPRADAVALAQLLLQAPPAGDGPWRRAVPGGQRTITLEPA